MKAVILAGGLGTPISEESNLKPKPGKSWVGLTKSPSRNWCKKWCAKTPIAQNAMNWSNGMATTPVTTMSEVA